jgi:hypothetical protein
VYVLHCCNISRLEQLQLFSGATWHWISLVAAMPLFFGPFEYIDLKCINCPAAVARVCHMVTSVSRGVKSRLSGDCKEGCMAAFKSISTVSRFNLCVAGVALARNLVGRVGHLVLQFEDPAPGLQQLREKLELDMLLATPWVTEPAAAALAAAEKAELIQQAAARQLLATATAAQKRQQQQVAGQQAGHVGMAPGPGNSIGQEQQQGSEAQNTAAADDVDRGAGHDTRRSPASHLVLPSQLQQRITQELKIHKHQASTPVWLQQCTCRLAAVLHSHSGCFTAA